MTKEELYNNICEEFCFVDCLYEEFDFNLQISNKTYYDKEYLKFLAIWKLHFFDKNRLVYMINSYEIELKDGIINHLFDLLLYFYSNKNEIEVITIGLFLKLYSISVSQKEHKNCPNHDKALKEIKILINTNKKLWYELEKKINKTLIETIEYSIESDTFVNQDIIYAINYICNNETKEHIINILIENHKYYSIIYEFDTKIIEHKEKYLEYIESQLNLEYNYGNKLRVLKKLCIYNTIEDEDIRNIINIYINKINDIKNKYNNNENFIQLLSYIDDLKNELNEIKEFIPNKQFIPKIKECLTRLLAYKRIIISDEIYVNENMQTVSFKIEIENEVINSINQSIKKDLFSFYKPMLLSLNNEISTSIKSHAEHPINSMASHFLINATYESYETNTNTFEDKNAYIDYINNFGKQYAEENKIILRESPYEILMNYEMNSFNFVQTIVFKQFTKEEFDLKMKALQDNLNVNFKNDYVFIASLILAVEYSTIKVLQKLELSFKYNEGYQNICKLFEYIVNNVDDEKIRTFSINGLFYCIYVLYDKRGYNLRNNIMHGNLIGKDIKLELLMTNVCLIILSGIEHEFF